MTGENAAQEEDGASSGSDAELDQAIDDLRGVLKKDKEPTAAAVGEGRAAAAAGGRAGDGLDHMSTASGKAFADFDDFGAPSAAAGASPAGSGSRMDLVMDIPIEVQIVLGTSRMSVSALMDLSEGSTIALERKIGEPVEITVNGRIIGHGEITVMEGDENRFGVRLLDLDNGRG